MDDMKPALKSLLEDFLAAEAENAPVGPRDETPDCPALVELVRFADQSAAERREHPQFRHIRSCEHCQRVVRLRERRKAVAASQWDTDTEGAFRLSDLLSIFLFPDRGLSFQPVAAYRGRPADVSDSVSESIDTEIEIPGLSGSVHVEFERTPDADEVAIAVRSSLRDEDGERLPTIRLQLRDDRGHLLRQTRVAGQTSVTVPGIDSGEYVLILSVDERTYEIPVAVRAGPEV